MKSYLLLLYRLLIYNVKVIFGNKFVYFVAAAFLFFAFIIMIAILDDDPLAAVSAHAIATIPATPATLTATYRSVAAWSPVIIERFNPVLKYLETVATEKPRHDLAGDAHQRNGVHPCVGDARHQVRGAGA